MSRFFSKVTGEFVDSLLSWVTPTECQACKKPAFGSSFCKTCLPLKAWRGPACIYCGRDLSVSVVCGRCALLAKPVLNKTRSCFILTEESRNILHEIKFRKSPELIFRILPQIPPDPLKENCNAVIIPIPLHWKKWVSRGFNLPEILATELSHLWSIPTELRGFHKKKETAPQSSLDSVSRAKNLIGAFTWNRKYKAPVSVILIDDVFTTGATLWTAASILKRNGVKEVSAWTLFRTPKKKSVLKKISPYTGVAYSPEKQA